MDTKNSTTAYVMSHRLITVWVLDWKMEDGSLVTSMPLAHPLHPIRSRSRNKRQICGLDDVFPIDDLSSDS